MTEKRYHRIRHYPGRYSGFDQIEECSKPNACLGCEFDHAICSKDGKVIEPEKYRAKLEIEASKYGSSR